MKERITFALVRCWCYLAHPWVMAVDIVRARSVPDPATPVTVRDKFLWRKLFDRNPLFETACDKTAAKRYVQPACPELKFARVLWTGRDPAHIPDTVLAGDVVVKANHASGWYQKVRAGKPDAATVRRRARRWVRRRYGGLKGEWGYANAARCLLVEEMLRQEDGQPVRAEYKFHVAGGRTAYVFVARDRGPAGVETFALDRDGRASAVSAARDHPRSGFELPVSFERMRRIAEALAAPFDFVRCDLYDLDGDIYFSELTVYPASGHGSIGNAPLMDLRNALWDLRTSWFLTVPQQGWRKLYTAALRRTLDARGRGDKTAV